MTAKPKPAPPEPHDEAVRTLERRLETVERQRDFAIERAKSAFDQMRARDEQIRVLRTALTIARDSLANFLRWARLGANWAATDAEYRSLQQDVGVCNSALDATAPEETIK
jgi:Xaa-Pro aminopeptidase